MDYLQDEVPVYGDGSWVSNKTIHAGTKVARLVNKYTGRAYNSTEWSQQTPFQGLVRSFYIPQDDPSYGYQGDASRRTGYRLEQRSWLYDDAVAALAFTYAGERDRARSVLSRLAELQRADGSFDFSFDTFIGTVFDRYERSGASAWAGYAATEYQRVTGDPSFELMARRVADRLLQLQVTTTHGFDEDDPRYGSVLGGTGRYDDNYDYVDDSISWASTEHNIDAYFFLRDLGYLTQVGRYAGAAALVKESLVQHHWNETLHRFNQGVGHDGPDTARALDLASWGGLFMLAIGDEDRAADAATELQRFWPVQRIQALRRRWRLLGRAEHRLERGDLGSAALPAPPR